MVLKNVAFVDYPNFFLKKKRKIKAIIKLIVNNSVRILPITLIAISKSLALRFSLSVNDFIFVCGLNFHSISKTKNRHIKSILKICKYSPAGSVIAAVIYTWLSDLFGSKKVSNEDTV
jgi:hypothetical protein